MWKSFFLYTRSEQRGIIVLIILILLIVAARFTMPYWAVYFVNNTVDEEFVQQVRQLNAQLLAQNNSPKSDSLFYFNPNTASEEELKALGFTHYQLKSLIGYRTKVKEFMVKADLLKVYGMDTSLFIKIKPYILLDKQKKLSRKKSSPPPEAPQQLEWINFNRQEGEFWEQHILSDSIRSRIIQLTGHNYITKSLPLHKVNAYSDDQLYQWLLKNSRTITKPGDKLVALSPPHIELNAADTTQLMQLPGIGSRLSLRIVNFRNSLGGFYHISQLADVYGISDKLFNDLQKCVSVNPTLIQKMDVQHLSLKEISRHHYFTYQQARELKNLYRKNTTPKPADILKLKSISEQDWEKIKHYLIFSK
ncbi:Helix-hairpin-helix motif-containing protein [Saccharicrinis carchari]|uniref:Helix-hairpin-helix motif-containing protein n=1 Tax=Saccharicrinis carchari TaxID=1168039 RepID=A0A521E4N5_SACCC|nr:helix-hairpin-helix domain-containing protein [Saccharicrinis carchari]SMO78331.1 Helix-hairpin-helix motif-containing protein [Saccharicrinis carchari]